MTRAALVNNIECGWSFLTYITERERERERERGMKPGSRNSQNSHH